MVVIVDYNVGNLGSIQNMLKKIHAKFLVSSDPKVILDADKLILPGVGSFDIGMKNLNHLGLDKILRTKAVEMQSPILGICLGMQLMALRSEEGGVLPGLGWIDAEVLKFSNTNDSKLKIPFMGWAYPTICKQSKLFTDLDINPKFYFVHSYYVKVHDSNELLASVSYGNPFAAAVEKGNIIGVQFHPEKSHKYGMQLLKNFINLY